VRRPGLFESARGGWVRSGKGSVGPVVVAEMLEAVDDGSLGRGRQIVDFVERAQEAIDRAGPSITPQALKMFARTARKQTALQSLPADKLPVISLLQK
jgi:hypothetical protein